MEDLIWQKFVDSKKVIIFSHKDPDADAVGSNCALHLLLEKLGKQVTSACCDSIPQCCYFLPYAQSFQTDFSKMDLNDYDLVISTDVSSIDRIHPNPDIQSQFKEHKNSIVIDHHSSNEGFGTLNFIDAKSASTTQILYKLFQKLNIEINEEMATCLLAGIYFDTASFMNANVDIEVLEISSALQHLGANQQLIVKNLFKIKPIKQLKALGEVLNNAYINSKGIVVSAIKDADMENVSGAVHYLNMTEEAIFTALLADDQKGHIKGSLRTRDNNINVRDIAQSLGGGGHKLAAGFTINGNLKRETEWKITSP